MNFDCRASGKLCSQQMELSCWRNTRRSSGIYGVYLEFLREKTLASSLDLQCYSRYGYFLKIESNQIHVLFYC